MYLPAAFAMATALWVASRAGSLVSDSVPKWNTRVFSIRSASISSAFRQVSAPGLRAKLKSRLPLASSDTKASVVNWSGSTTTPRVSMPASLRVPSSRRPNMSSPTLPIMATEQPYLFSAARKLPGAPPGFAARVG